jgi:hypothetical protein
MNKTKMKIKVDFDGLGTNKCDTGAILKRKNDNKSVDKEKFLKTPVRLLGPFLFKAIWELSKFKMRDSWMITCAI